MYYFGFICQINLLNWTELGQRTVLAWTLSSSCKRVISRTVSLNYFKFFNIGTRLNCNAQYDIISI